MPGDFSATDLMVQTSVANQVNLIVAAPSPTVSSFNFWDGPNMTANGAVDGGSGTWSSAGTATAGGATSRFSAFSETGADTQNLSGTGSRDKLTRYGIGGFTRYSGASGYFDLTAYYVPGDREDARATLSMGGSPQASTVLAPRGSKSSVHVSASSQYNVTESLSLGGNVGVDRGSDERDVHGHVRLSYRF